ncbi:hypothetical protein L1987_10957 [Smallanthus sonchifolius]|uniref:Uncharacterized protein n=1 Tax=Smallanthus sonchifolius TaxID=185202 RepID=A0ACB9JB44_9ASTR|nr:hypothetical protein L1987_10957 [Smallanthus sonchifolius]
MMSHVDHLNIRYCVTDSNIVLAWKSLSPKFSRLNKGSTDQSCLTTQCQSSNSLNSHTQILSYLLLAIHGFGWPLSLSDQFQPNLTLFHHDLSLS